jgi:hypothetical protein
MDTYKRGNEFEVGDVVYVVGPIVESGCSAVRLQVLDDSHKYPFSGGITYYYDSDDELWATPAVRYKWSKYPYKHPHATLFTTLHYFLERDLRYDPID